jgi:type IV pilus assembly protein PilO
MTNLQSTRRLRLSRELVLRGGPLLLGALLALLTAQVVLVPLLSRTAEQQTELDALQQQSARLPFVRRRLAQLRTSVEQAEQRQAQLLQLIAGNGETSTFMAELGLAARQSGVQLEGYEPISAAPRAASPAPAPAPASPVPPPTAAPAPDPLEASGLDRTRLLITARGRGDQLQDFLRRLERLRLLAVQSDLSIRVDPAAAGRSTLRLSLSLYSKGPEVQQP